VALEKCVALFSNALSSPILDGRMYFRGADGIYCYDPRKNP